MISIDEINKLKEENAKLNAIIDGYQPRLQKYKEILQEIKKIAEENQFYFGAGTIVSYKTIKQLATNFEKILDLITKAEEE